MAQRGAPSPSRGTRARLGFPEHLFLPPIPLQSEVDTEYSEPFDAQPHPPPPDDGYMEPYDAQRVMSGEWPGLGGRWQGPGGKWQLTSALGLRISLQRGAAV